MICWFHDIVAGIYSLEEAVTFEEVVDYWNLFEETYIFGSMGRENWR